MKKKIPKYQKGKQFIPITYDMLSPNASYASDNTRVQQFVPISQEQMTRNHINSVPVQHTVSKSKPQSTISKAKAIALNPMTAATYVINKQRIPDNFELGRRSIADYATDVINPAFYINAGKEAVTNTGEGVYNLSQGNVSNALFNFGTAGLNALAVAPFVPKGVKVLRAAPEFLTTQTRKISAEIVPNIKKIIIKKPNNDLSYLSKRANYQGDHLQLTKTRLNNEGYDRLMNNEINSGHISAGDPLAGNEINSGHISAGDPLELDKQYTLYRYSKLRQQNSRYNNYSQKTRDALNSIESFNTDDLLAYEDMPEAYADEINLSMFKNQKKLNEIGFKNLNNEVDSHEFSHLISTPTENPKGFNNFFNLLIKPRFHKTSPFYNPKTNIIKKVKDFIYMFDDKGDEIKARGTQLKNYFGIKDKNDEFTEDMLRYAKDNYINDVGMDNNMTSFFNLISDYKKASKWINKHSPVIIPTIGTAAALQQQKNGGLIQYQKAGKVVNPNNPVNLNEVVIKEKRNSLTLPNQIFATNTRDKILADRRNKYFPYETEQTRKIRDLADEKVFQSSGDLISGLHPTGAIINALANGVDNSAIYEAFRFLPTDFSNTILLSKDKVNRIPGGISIFRAPAKIIDYYQSYNNIKKADSLYKSADSIDLYNQFKGGGEMIKRADGSYSRRGLWDNIRANRGSGKKPTKQMLEQERKIRNNYQSGGEVNLEKKYLDIVNKALQEIE